MTIEKRADGIYEKVDNVERRRVINKPMLEAEKVRLQERIAEIEADIVEIEAAEGS